MNPQGLLLPMLSFGQFFERSVAKQLVELPDDHTITHVVAFVGQFGYPLLANDSA